MKKGMFSRGALAVSRLSAFATPVGQVAMMESNAAKNAKPPAEKPPAGDKSEDALMEAVSKKALQDSRGTAAAAVIDWAQNGEATFASFDDIAAGLADIDFDSDEDLTEDQIDDYNMWLGLMADALVAMGADQSDVTTMIDDADDDSASAVIDAIDVNPDDEDDIIAEFSVTGDVDGAAMMEANVKVVRSGVVKIIRKRPRPRRQTAAQKAALKKNRMKSHKASANKLRKKSLLLRKRRGL
ncbi:hypothetical protein [Yersinia ruckeri]|uniref:hypothetical protein n=1 Tax=Yersinia ruckeri TaxID=29486 RepID=UPI0020C093E6|nr:hypothetical protein [Yersinia ruckeri]MCK8586407.1 hypothetical protein [Yersinia ruckeri]MCW6615649.1 hypothetical protein [Yersinia ruckeri]